MGEIGLEKIIIFWQIKIIKKVNELTGMKITKLLYRASKDGFKAKNFHSKIENIFKIWIKLIEK